MEWARKALESSKTPNQKILVLVEKLHVHEASSDCVKLLQDTAVCSRHILRLWVFRKYGQFFLYNKALPQYFGLCCREVGEMKIKYMHQEMKLFFNSQLNLALLDLTRVFLSPECCSMEWGLWERDWVYTISSLETKGQPLVVVITRMGWKNHGQNLVQWDFTGWPTCKLWLVLIFARDFFILSWPPGLWGWNHVHVTIFHSLWWRTNALNVSFVVFQLHFTVIDSFHIQFFFNFDALLSLLPVDANSSNDYVLHLNASFCSSDMSSRYFVQSFILVKITFIWLYFPYWYLGLSLSFY